MYQLELSLPGEVRSQDAKRLVPKQGHQLSKRLQVRRHVVVKCVVLHHVDRLRGRDGSDLQRVDVVVCAHVDRHDAGGELGEPVGDGRETSRTRGVRHERAMGEREVHPRREGEGARREPCVLQRGRRAHRASHYEDAPIVPRGVAADERLKVSHAVPVPRRVLQIEGVGRVRHKEDVELQPGGAERRRRRLPLLHAWPLRRKGDEQHVACSRACRP